MPEPHDIEAVLRGVRDPELGSDIVDLGMVRSIEVDDEGHVTVRVALTIAACPMRDQIENDVIRKAGSLPGVAGVTVEIGAMEQSERSALMELARMRARENAVPTRVSPTTRVIAVSSGKGGVGKSSLSVNLALAIAARGHRTGILDADIWGFSIPRMLGLNEQRIGADEERRIVPIEIHGLQVVSTGLMLDNEDTALMWRGLMLSKALEQFLRDVAWDPSLAYLVLDMPPGTGDVQMALSRLLPQAELVVVTTPQLAAQKVATRVADMARRSHVPVVGVIENMSGFTTEDGRHYEIFGRGGGAALAADLGVPLLGTIPLDPFVVAGGDSGDPVVLAHPDSAAGAAVHRAADRLLEIVPPAGDDTCTARVALLAEQLAQLD